MENDSVNFFRYKNLLDNNATSKAEYDRASLAYQVSKNDYLGRKNNYERIKRQLYVELQNAESLYKASAKEEQNFFVKSLLNGIVYELYKEEGEAVRRNDPVALLGDPNEVYLRLSVDQLDIERIRIGQEVLVKVDVFKDKVFKAKVTRIHKKMNIQDQSFRVDAEFVGEKPSSYYGLTVEANIVIGTKENALTIPKNILSGQDSLYVKTEDGIQKIKIKKGVEDFDHVEVLQGINANTEIVNQ
jgi:multidrug efflux pump subunit AcrA (membrane-fusion protein)